MKPRSSWPPGQKGEYILPGTFVDYELLKPRGVRKLAVAQTVLPRSTPGLPICSTTR